MTGPVGTYLLVFFGAVVAVSLALIGWRGDRLRSPGAIDSPISREGAFLANNVLFTVFAFVVLLGTVFPLLVEALQDRRTVVGAPYFDRLSTPIGLALLFLMAVAPVLPWRKASMELLRDRLFWPAWCGAATLVVALAVGASGLAPLVAFGLAGCAAGSAGRQLVLATRRQGWRGLVGRANGGMVVHIGVIMIAVALVASNSYTRSATLALEVGEERSWGGHTFELQEVRETVDERARVVTADVLVDGDRVYGPATTKYLRQGIDIGTPSVRTGPANDVYLTLERGAVPGAAEATIRVFVKPLILWLWIGGAVMAIGTLLAAFPGARRRRPTDAVSAPGPRARRGGAVTRARLAPFIALVVAIVAAGLFVVLAGADATTNETAETTLMDQAAPEAIGELADGTAFDLARRKGDWVVLNFFQSSCVPCQQEHPELVRFAEQQEALPDGARLYTVVYDDDRDNVEAFFDAEGGDWPIVYDDDGSIAVAFGVSKVPETWIIDPSGVVRGRIISPVSAEFLGAQLQLLRERAVVKRWPGWVLLVLVVVGALAVGASPRRRAEHAGRAGTGHRAAHRLPGVRRGERLRVAEHGIGEHPHRHPLLRRRRRAERRRDRRCRRVRFGGQVLLVPKASGFDALVWALPVAALVCAIAGLAVTFRRWRREAADRARPDRRGPGAGGRGAGERGRSAGGRDASMNPDRLAELEDERRFLLRSLRDLDAELDAGDVDAPTTRRSATATRSGPPTCCATSRRARPRCPPARRRAGRGGWPSPPSSLRWPSAPVGSSPARRGSASATTALTAPAGRTTSPSCSPRRGR